MATSRLRRVDRAGDREHLAPGVARHPRGDERARLQRGLDDKRALSEPGDDAVAQWEVRWQRGCAQGELAHDHADIGDPVRQLQMPLRVNAVQPGAHHGHGAAWCRQPALVGSAIDPQCHARNDRVARATQMGGKRPGVVGALGRGVAAAHDGDRRGVQQVDAALRVQQQRRVGSIKQGAWVAHVAQRDDGARLGGVGFQPRQGRCDQRGECICRGGQGSCGLGADHRAPGAGRCTDHRLR